MKKIIYLLLFFCCFITTSKASHIVGAEIYYDCLGGSTYHITLIEYRNCSPSCVNCAGYGEPEYIQVFDTAGNYIDSFAAPYTTPDTIATISTGTCAYPNDYCIEVATFQATATLPYIPGGYVVVFQRCCRNSAIMNIPANTGATYFTIIPDSTVVTGCDNKPRFRVIAPGIMPVDTLFTFDMSATDPDGDSLAYRLTNSFDGASSACPDPAPTVFGSSCPNAASPPPYISVPYLSPYSITNPTNNPLDSGHLRIDPQTGLLSGTVNESGIFLVAVAADEYRNGALIGTTLLDFQFLFGGCPIDTTVNTDTTVINGISTVTEKGAIRIYSIGSEAVVNFSGESYGPAKISFYDMMGRNIAEGVCENSDKYEYHFDLSAPQYIIVKVTLGDGSTVRKNVLIQARD